MADNFAVYVPFRGLPTSEQLEALVPDATISADDERATVTWPDVSVTITTMAFNDVPQHLHGFVGFVRNHGGSDALVTRIMHTLGVLGCVVEPGFDDGDRAIGLCARMTSASSGICFVGNTVRDGSGRDLLDEGMLRPSAEAVRYRAEVLLACAVRALLEDDAGKPDHDKAEEIRREIVAWATKDNARIAAFEDDEAAFLQAPLGTVVAQDVINAVWAAEAACVMLWALGAYPLPPFDVTEHPYAIAKAVGVRGKAPPTLATAQLRSDDELREMHRRLTGIHWRMREWSFRQDKLVDFPAFAAKNFFAPFSVEGLALADGDLAIAGRPLLRADAGACKTAMSIARERHRGINWVMGVHDMFSYVQAPT